MRLLLTGGAGYIGAHLVVELLAAGHDLVVVDDLSAGFERAVRRAEALAGRRCDFVKGNIGDRAVVDPLLARVDAVIHLAAFKLVGESMDAPGRYFRNNTGALATLLEAMDDAGVRKIVYSSSAAVYGTPRSVPLREGAALSPENPYGLSKVQGEQMVDWMARLKGWSAISLRYFNPVGAHESGRIGQPSEGASALVPRALMAVAGRAPELTVFGNDWPTPDGTCLRDYIHVDDLARAHELALAKLGNEGHSIFNVGTGRPHSVREVLDSCLRVVGRPVPAVDGPRRQGDVAVSCADPSAFQAATGFRAAKGLDAMVASAWRWVRDNPRDYAEG
jgi:UDP-glucose 4-epimerase